MTGQNSYQTIFETVSDVFVIAELVFQDDQPVDYRLIDVNPAFKKIFGYSRKQSIGRLASDVFGIKPPPFLDKYAKVLASAKTLRFETYVDFVEKHLLITIYPETDQRIISTATDITEIIHQQEKPHYLDNRLIPICSNCKKIRNETGQWEQVEAYFGKHTKARFSHGICPDCMQKLYPGFVVNKTNKEETR